MAANNLLTRSLVVSFLLLISIELLPQAGKTSEDHQPMEGQEGKNVPWIVTPQILVDKMLALAKITPKDFLIDLGSGDGRTVITAARLGTRGLGIEYNPDLVKLSKKNAEKAGLSDMAQFIEADIFASDFSKATVITMFLLPEINLRLRSKLLNLKPGTRIVTNTFTMQEWHYDAVAVTGDEKARWNTAYLWIVPAKVDGKWSLAQGGELIFNQEFQMVTGTMVKGNRKIPVKGGKLTGNSISFTVEEDVYSGTVSGNRIEGTITSGGNSRKWSAAR